MLVETTTGIYCKLVDSGGHPARILSNHVIPKHFLNYGFFSQLGMTLLWIVNYGFEKYKLRLKLRMTGDIKIKLLLGMFVHF